MENKKDRRFAYLFYLKSISSSSLVNIGSLKNSLGETSKARNKINTVRR